VAVRAGAARPDVRTVEAFKVAVVNAKNVAVPASTSGIWLTDELFPRLGIAGKVHATKAPRGADATRMLAAGEADLVIMPISEIFHAKGVDFVGSIDPEIQFVQTFSAAVVAGSKQVESAKRLIQFLTSARASEAIKDSGMEPLTAAK
jgi:molybdate transport system substrate-binding protein